MKRSIGPRTIIYPAPVLVVCTYDGSARPNGMTVAWGGMCCSKPPCIGVSLRKATYTYQNIIERKAFTINIPSERYIKEVDFFGIVSGRDKDKFAITGLTPVKSDTVDAPYIEEFHFAMECELAQVIELGVHTQFIGEIKDVKADESVLTEAGTPDIERIRPLVYAPELRGYYGVGDFLGRAFSIGNELLTGRK